MLTINDVIINDVILQSGLGGARLALTIIPANKSGDTGLSEVNIILFSIYMHYNIIAL